MQRCSGNWSDHTDHPGPLAMFEISHKAQVADANPCLNELDLRRKGLSEISL